MMTDHGRDRMFHTVPTAKDVETFMSQIEVCNGETAPVISELNRRRQYGALLVAWYFISVMERYHNPVSLKHIDNHADISGILTALDDIRQYGIEFGGENLRVAIDIYVGNMLS